MSLSTEASLLALWIGVWCGCIVLLIRILAVIPEGLSLVRSSKSAAGRAFLYHYQSVVISKGLQDLI